MLVLCFTHRLFIGGAEDGIIPGRPVPEVSHVEAHTDYGRYAGV